MSPLTAVALAAAAAVLVLGGCTGQAPAPRNPGRSSPEVTEGAEGRPVLPDADGICIGRSWAL
jgi:hypothetical protein